MLGAIVERPSRLGERRPRRRTRRLGATMRRRTMVRFVAVLVIAAGGTAAVVATAYMPLTYGSITGPDSNTPDSLFLRTQAPQASRDLATWLYCARPNGRFAWLVSLRNDGPLPVTLLGAGDDPSADLGGPDGYGFRLVGLGAYRSPTPTDTPLSSHQASDPRSVPALSPTAIAPGDEFEVWARFQIGGRVALDNGASMSMPELPIRYSVLGITRTARVPVSDAVGITQAGDCLTR